METRKAIAFLCAAAGILAAVAWVSLRAGNPEVPAPPAAPAPEVVEAEVAPPPPAQPEPEAKAAEVPAHRAPEVARATNKVVYTTSAMGEPMEVHPDGKVVIHNHRKVIRFADGREEVRYVRVTAVPAKPIPRDAIKALQEN